MALRFALAGNPNSGKTTLFNALTGSNAHVGNWPGVTVERKEGIYKSKVLNELIFIIDLPGIYSTSPYTPEEVVARNYIINERPDAIINIVDATNLARNLYLTTELIETDIPVIVALNFIDVIEKDNIEYDIKILEDALGIKIIPISAFKKKGIDKLITEALEAVKTDKKAKSILHNAAIGKEIKNITDILRSKNIRSPEYTAIKLIEGDKLLFESLNLDEQTRKAISETAKSIAVKEDDDIEAIIANYRYEYITEYCEHAVKKHKKLTEMSKSDKIDAVLTHRIWGLPIFFIIMFTMFFLVFGQFTIAGITIMMPGVLFANGVEFVIGWIGEGLARLLMTVNASDWSAGLVLEGIYGGIGAVLGFLPFILVMYLLIAVLEATGYMSRAAFVMDRAFRKFGLSGKSFVPMLMGFGCSVPAIMGTRTLNNENERRLTILVTPFMSCGAKLPIWLFLTAAFFEGITATFVLFGIYILGIVMAVITGLIFKKFVFKKQPSPFIMEMPEYRVPSIKALGRILFDKFTGFIKKAGTVVLVSTVIIWLLQSFNFSFRMVDDVNDSMMATIGGVLAYIFKPLGFGNWQASFAILTGFVAKEMVVATFGTLSGMGKTLENEGIMEQVQTWIVSAGIFVSPVAVLSFMAFILLAPPCLAAIGTITQELKSKKWTIIVLLYQTAVAYIAALIIYGIGNLIMIV